MQINSKEILEHLEFEECIKGRTQSIIDLMCQVSDETGSGLWRDILSWDLFQINLHRDCVEVYKSYTEPYEDICDENVDFNIPLYWFDKTGEELKKELARLCIDYKVKTQDSYLRDLQRQASELGMVVVAKEVLQK